MFILQIQRFFNLGRRGYSLFSHPCNFMPIIRLKWCILQIKISKLWILICVNRVISLISRYKMSDYDTRAKNKELQIIP